jgi:hypothetical protein
MSEYDLKCFELGKKAKVLLDLNLEDTKRFTAEFILEQLFNDYAKHKLDTE